MPEVMPTAARVYPPLPESECATVPAPTPCDHGHPPCPDGPLPEIETCC